MKLSEKAAYIKGLIEGLEPDPADKQTKVLKTMSELLIEMAQEISELEQCYDDVCDQVDGIEEDLAGVEDLLCEDEDLFGDYDFGDDELSSDYAYEATCPECGTTISLSEATLSNGTMKCPECGEVLEFDYEEDELDDGFEKEPVEE